MNKPLLISVVALATAVALTGGVKAAGRDPMVVQGVTPGSQNDPFHQQAQPRRRAAGPAYARQAPGLRHGRSTARRAGAAAAMVAALLNC